MNSIYFSILNTYRHKNLQNLTFFGFCCHGSIKLRQKYEKNEQDIFQSKRIYICYVCLNIKKNLLAIIKIILCKSLLNIGHVPKQLSTWVQVAAKQVGTQRVKLIKKIIKTNK